MTTKKNNKDSGRRSTKKMRVPAPVLAENLGVNVKPIVSRAKKMELDVQVEWYPEKKCRTNFIYGTEKQLQELKELCKGITVRGEGKGKAPAAKLEDPKKGEISIEDARVIYGMSASGFKKKINRNKIVTAKRAVLMEAEIKKGQHKGHTIEQSYGVLHINEKEMYKVLGEPTNKKNTLDKKGLLAILGS